MAKGGNPALKAKALAESGLRKRGCVQSGRYVPEYDQGINAFRDGEQLNRYWSNAKQQGWKKAREREIEFFFQTGSDGALRRLEAVGMGELVNAA